MSDRMKIVGKDGKTRYTIEGEDVMPGPHKHKFNVAGVCGICRKTRDEINKESHGKSSL